MTITVKLREHDQISIQTVPKEDVIKECIREKKLDLDRFLEETSQREDMLPTKTEILHFTSRFNRQAPAEICQSITQTMMTW